MSVWDDSEWLRDLAQKLEDAPTDPNYDNMVNARELREIATRIEGRW